MKETAYLINTARGAIIDEKSLYRALKERWIAGAALDVMEKEPPDWENSLLQLDNLIITPHIAFYSEESYDELKNKTAKAVLSVLKGELPNHLYRDGSMVLLITYVPFFAMWLFSILLK
jgi:D-3-phosphoglycerate dehydrogenase